MCLSGNKSNHAIITLSLYKSRSGNARLISRTYMEQFVNAFLPDPGRLEKTNVKFYFHTFLWCQKRFCEGLRDLCFRLEEDLRLSNQS